MKNSFLCSVSVAVGILAMCSVAIAAKQYNPIPYGDNVFCWWSEIPDSPTNNTVVKAKTSIIGTGGITVKAVAIPHRFTTNDYEVAIDGSGLLAGGGSTATKESSDFNATVGTAYFVSNSATCTFPSADGLAGKEILVWNAAPNISVKYNTVQGQSVSGNASGTLSNSTAYKLDRFMSDGSNWFKE